jgi:hypothetical protein
MVFEGFIGPSSEARSPNANLERTVNLYLETGGGGAGPKTRANFYGTPGLSLFSTLPKTPVRGVWANATNLYAVAGDTLYDVFSDGTFNARGTVGDDGLPVQFFPNGNQLLIVSAGDAYCDSGAGPVAVTFDVGQSGTMTVTDVSGHPSVCHWETGDLFSPNLVGVTITIGGTTKVVASVASNGLSMILTTGSFAPVDPQAWSGTPTLPAQSGAFLDNYFIVSAPNTRQINISAIGDGTSWSALDFALKEGYPDNILAIFADHEELWLFGTDTTEVWQDTGAADFPFARIPGAFIHHGCAAQFSPVRLRAGVAWLTSDPARGGVRAVFAQGFQPEDISLKAVPTVWESYSTIADAVSFTYVEGGHEYWVITFPTANATWCFDGTENSWAERGWWNGASNDRQRQMFHAFVFGKHIAGDWSNGKLYQQSIALLDDDGTDIHWERTFPHLSKEQQFVFFAYLQIDMEVGTSGSAPSVSLSWSDDGGHTFNTPIARTPDIDNYTGRIIWRRLGYSRDRVFRVTGTSSAGGTRVALLQALLGVLQGNS